MDRDVSAAPPPGGTRLDRAAWWSLLACTCATAVLQIDGTMVTAAIPALSRELAVDTATADWVLIAYFLPFAVLLLPGGRLTDRAGARRVALLGLLVFAAGAVVGALAPTAGVLIASRVLQGIAAGLISPAALVGAVSAFPAERRGRAIGIWGAGSGAMSLAGPLVGGVLTATLGWRSNWWALLVVSVGAGLAIARFAPGRPAESEPEPERGPGASGRRAVGVSTILAGATFLVLVLGFLIGQEYLQQVLGLSPLAASALLLVAAVTSGLVTPLAGWLSDRLGDLVPLTSGLLLLVTCLGLLGTGLVPLDTPVTVLLLVVIGAGLGFLFSPTARAALNAVPRAQHGRVSAWLSVGRLVGAAVGAAVAAAAAVGGLTVPHVRSALLVAALVCAASLGIAQLLRTRRALPVRAS